MSRNAFSDRVINRYIRQNFVNGVFTLFGKKYFVYSLLLIITISISIGANKLLSFQNSLLLENITIFEISIIFAFIISGFLAFKLKSTVGRLLSIGAFSIVFFLLFNTLLYNFWKDILNLFILINMGMICLSFLIIIRNFNISWIAKLMVMGKAKNTTAFHSLNRSIWLGIGLSVYLVYLFLNPDPFKPINYNNIFLAIFNVIANLFTFLIVLKKSFYDKYPGHDFFAQTISFFYIFAIVPLILINIFLKEAVLLLINFGIIIFTILVLAQAISLSRSKLEEKLAKGVILQRLEEIESKKDLYKNKDEKDIIIINIEDESEIPIEKPKGKKSEKRKPEVKKPEKQKPEVASSKKDGIMIIFLGLCISFHFLIIQFLFNGNTIFSIFPNYPIIKIPFTLEDLDSYISIIAFGIIIATIILYFGSKKIRDIYSNNIKTQTAFWEFLTLIERSERIKFLTEFAETIRETFVSGIMDFIDRTREEIESTIKEGIDFIRRLFGTG